MRFLLTLLTGLLVGTAGAGANDPAQATPTLSATKCPELKGMAQTTKRRVSCATLIVPQRHEQPGGRRLALRVTILHAARRTAEPLVVLSGGPGEALSPDVLASPSLRRAAGAGRDLVLLDQRGTGRSRPSLACPEVSAPTVLKRYYRLLAVNESRAGRFFAGHLATCRERLKSTGVDLTAFNTAQNAQDVIALTRALRAPRVSLYALSYGARLALDVMRLAPQKLRAVILDSPLPDDVDYDGLDDVEAFDGVLYDALTLCERDEACRDVFPNATRRFLQVLDGYRRRRLSVQINAFPSGPFMYRVGPRDVLGVLRIVLYHANAAVYLPSYLAAFETRDATLMSFLLTEQFRFAFQGSLGVRITTSCQDNAGYRAKRSLVEFYPGLSSVVPLRPSRAAEACTPWVGQASRNLSRLPLLSGLRVLILSARLDPATPPVYARRVQGRVPGAFLVSFERGGHVVLLGEDGSSSTCARDVVSAFLGSPNTAPPRTCLRESIEFFAAD